MAYMQGVASSALTALWLSLSSAPGEQERVAFFERKVRPVLVERCYGCHSHEAKKVHGGLYLDSREALLKGGDSGAAVVPGKPAESLLLRAISYRDPDLRMPPDGKLPPQTIAAFTEWVKLGAAWPDENLPAQIDPEDSGYDWSRFRQEHWAFRPVKKPALPSVSDASWALQPVDRFVLAGLEARGMTPAPMADRRTLIRRVYFDLIGLPPTPADVEAFLLDDSEKALSRVVDRLLASPQHGERWGRHWLDVARYNHGFGNGYEGGKKLEAFHYRDWVVSAFNRDLPYDKFIEQQLAGDLLGEGIRGTGFLAVGPKYRSDGGDPQGIANATADTLEDRMDTTFRGLQALTLACARCHDHKFDPIPMQDYYSIAGVFNNTKLSELPLASEKTIKRYNDRQQAILEIERPIHKLRVDLIKHRVSQSKDPKKEVEEEIQAKEKKLAVLVEARDLLLESAPPKYPFVLTVADSGNADMHVALRGNLRKPGELAPRRFLKILSGDDRTHWTEGSGRLDLARAITRPDNPLTARVFVNRVWMHHFGHAIVRTPGNFGILGEKPTHPELLDWLASYLVENDWSIKKLHRLILLSASYQMNSAFHEEHFHRDGENRWLWRMSPRRLTVEELRDGLLAASGELDLRLGGEPTQELLQSQRRTVYTVISRTGDHFESDLFLRLFDFPDARFTSEKRPVSTAPQQFLFLLNSPFMVERARALAERLHTEAQETSERLKLAYLLLFSRLPTEEETNLGFDYLQREGKGLPRWQQYAQVLLGAQEFLFVQ